MAKIVVLGLDGFNPEFVRQWLDELPNLIAMQREGLWGDLQSIIPPTAVAWVSAQCGQNPGWFGFWNINYRDDFSYKEAKFVDSEVIRTRVDPLYKILPRSGQRVAIINVPFTWPPVRIPGGYCVTDFTTPSLDRGFTYPDNLMDDVFKLVGEYIIDVPIPDVDPSKVDMELMLKRIYEMDTQRFSLLKYFICEKRCDYIFAVITGANKISRLFYHELDRERQKNNSGISSENALKKYYKFIDKNIGEIREISGTNTALLVHSSYRTQRTKGVVYINEWLVRKGFMTLFEYPSNPTPLDNLKVNWSKTKAWATGSDGHIYLNLKGREVCGVVDPDNYDRFLDELAERIKEIPSEYGKKLKVQVLRRNDIHFGPFAKYGPDLFVSFDNYHWKVSELVGRAEGRLCLSADGEKTYTVANGPYGYFCASGSKIPTSGYLENVSILGIAPTVLEIMGLPVPENMEESSLLTIGSKKEVKPSKELERIVESRLKALGY